MYKWKLNDDVIVLGNVTSMFESIRSIHMNKTVVDFRKIGDTLQQRYEYISVKIQSVASGVKSRSSFTPLVIAGFSIASAFAQLYLNKSIEPEDSIELLGTVNKFKLFVAKHMKASHIIVIGDCNCHLIEIKNLC